MQHFINHAAIERANAELFSDPRARYYLMGLVAIAVSACGGLALGAIWMGLALLVETTRDALLQRLAPLASSQANAAHLSLDAAQSACFASAPAMAWYSRADIGGAMAVAMLGLFLVNAAFNARRGRRHLLAACAPYFIVGILFMLESAALGALAAAAACALVAGYTFLAAVHHAHNASHARAQDAEWVRQLNMSFGDAQSAAWELDFVRERLVGAGRLSGVLGRQVSYADLVEHACFAPEADRPLVRAAFSPLQTGVRRIAIEHEVIDANGVCTRVRHQGFVRTAAEGTPLRLTCVTRRSEAAVGAAPELPADIANDVSAVLQSQNETLRTLANELSTPLTADMSPVSGDLRQMVQRLAQRCEALGDGVDALAHARHAAESANLAKSQFLANMSHELRTPLNAVIGYAEMLKEDAEDEDNNSAVQDLNRILAAAKHLLSLINEILDLSKIEAGRMDVAPTVFDPQEMLEDLVETIQPIADQNHNRVALSGDLSDLRARTDSLKLRQCVLNLLSNACKFTKQGEIEIAIDRRVQSGVDQLFITVRDTGIGMTPDHMGRLFQPFVQADPSITQRYGGTGLGLTITRRLAQLLGGDVSVTSDFGVGSSFTLHVPLDFADASAALGAAAKIDAIQGDNDAPLVIVIEDEPDARELAARSLTRAGFAVLGVGGGEAGLALARTKAPALVLLDIFLPDRSGWRVLQSLKHDPKTQDIPVVVLSVNEDRAHAIALGAAEHIVKPADRDVLAATVMRFARKRPTAAAAAASVAPLTQKQAG